MTSLLDISMQRNIVVKSLATMLLGTFPACIN